MPVYGKNKKKDGNDIELNTINEQNDMEIDGILPPQPDNYPISEHQNHNAQPSQSNQNIFNEEALKELIKKEENNLAKKENNQTKTLEEIKKDLNSLNNFLSNVHINLYEDSFFANLKKQINK